MTPEHYLYYSIQHKAYLNKDWVIRLFSVFKESGQSENYTAKLYREPYGFFFIDEQGEKVKIDIKRGDKEPLFNKKDTIEISKDIVSSIAETTPIKTTLGRLILNLFVIHEAFAGRLPYINRPFTPKDVERLIVKTLKDTPKPGQERTPGDYYVDEMLRFNEAVTFIKDFATLFAHSVTRAGLMPPPGRNAFRDKLMAEVKEKKIDLRDPVQMTTFEDKFRQFDEAYLKENDPSFGMFMSGKALGARLKTYMTQGGEANNFIDEINVTPILRPLDEGMVLKEEAFTASANTIRYGSFARGTETINGGVTAKAIMNAADTWRIIDTDCGVTYGAVLMFNEKEIHYLVGCTLIKGKTQIKINTIEEAKPYIGQVVEMRSPQFCQLEGTQTCKVCATDPLAKYPNGQIVPLMEVSSGIMNDSLKQMHNTVMSKKTVDWAKVIS